MPKVFGWAKKLTGRSQAKDAEQTTVKDSETETEGNDLTTRRSPEKKQKKNASGIEKCSPKVNKKLNRKSSPIKITDTDRNSSHEEQPGSVRKSSPEKRHNSDRRVSPEKWFSSSRKSSPEKRHNSDRRPSPEKRLSPEKKGSGLGKRFASFRILNLDRKSPDKVSRSKSKSPEPVDVVDGRGKEKMKENGECKKSEEFSATANKDTSEENDHVTFHNESVRETTRERDSTSDGRFKQGHSEDSIKGINTDNHFPDIPNTMYETSNPLLEGDPPPDKVSTPKIAKLSGRQSISEKLYGEVIKEFDKIRTKPKVSKTSSEASSSDDSKMNQTKCIEDGESSDRATESCTNSNVKNSRFKVSPVNEEDIHKHSSHNGGKGDLPVLTEDEETLDTSTANTINSSMHQAEAHSSEEPSTTRHSVNTGNFRSEGLFAPLVDAETIDSELSEDECIIEIPLSQKHIQPYVSPQVSEISHDISKVNGDIEASDSNITQDSTLPIAALERSDSNVTQDSTLPAADMSSHLLSDTLECFGHKSSTFTTEDSLDFGEEAILTSLQNAVVGGTLQAVVMDSMIILDESSDLQEDPVTVAENYSHQVDESIQLIDQSTELEESYSPEAVSEVSLLPQMITSNILADDHQNKSEPSLSCFCSDDVRENEPSSLEVIDELTSIDSEDSPFIHASADNNVNDQGSTDSINCIHKFSEEIEEILASNSNGIQKTQEHDTSIEASQLCIGIAVEKDISSLKVLNNKNISNGEGEDPWYSTSTISNDAGHPLGEVSIDHCHDSLEPHIEEVPVDNVIAEEANPENAVGIKEEILALLDKTFDNNHVSEIQGIDAVETLNEVKRNMNESCEEFEDSADETGKEMMNSSYDSSTIDGKVIPPIAQRRLSRDGSSKSKKGDQQHLSTNERTCLEDDSPVKGTSSQSISLTKLDGTGKKIEDRHFLNQSFGEHSGEERGGSLPTSPSAPRRRKNSHPVPATRSFNTLNSVPGAAATNGTPRKIQSTISSAPPRPPMPSSPYQLTLLQKTSSMTNQKTIDSVSEDSMLLKDTLTVITPPVQSAPTPKARTKISLNPFDSDDDEDSTAEVVKPETQQPKPSKMSLNPFDSDDEEDCEVPTTVQNSKAKPMLPPHGYNPFDEDDDEEEIADVKPVNNNNNNAKVPSNEIPNHSLLPPRKINVPGSPINSQPSRLMDNTKSTNPFDEEDEEDEEDDLCCGEATLNRASVGRQSLTNRSPSSFRRDGVRASLPSSGRIIPNKKKRQAPLPPGFKTLGTSSASSTPLTPRYQGLLTRGESSTSLDHSSLRRNSTTSCSSLSLTSPKRTPPPRPPPPKVKSVSMAQLK